MSRLLIKNFAHISKVELEFKDLTILVGAQGTGKSLALQWFKTALDGKQIVNALRDAGQEFEPNELVDQIFGVGMSSAWTEKTAVKLNNREIRLGSIRRIGDGVENVFFIPAHRAMLISDGWATPFQKLTPDIPVVARLFSQNLFDRFSIRRGETLFPLPRVLKQEYRSLIDNAVFHGGTVGLEKDLNRATRLKLAHGKAKLPFMTWTAGQREFTPLLLGLYHLLPPTKLRKRKEVDWVVIEEPEMGLHPQAIAVFMLLVFDLLWRGYKVVISTHSPTILSAVWMLRRLKELGASWHKLCDAFEIENHFAMRGVAEAAVSTDVAVNLLQFDGKSRIFSKDISTLDPGDEDDDISGWGGLTNFSSRFGNAVREAVNESTDEEE